MKKDRAIEILASIKNGTINKVVYNSDVKVCSASKKAGVAITKHTEKICRIGIDYSNIAQVKELKESGAMTDCSYKIPYVWDMKDKLAHHETNGNEYLRITYLPNGKTTSTYTMKCADGTEKMIDRAEVENHLTASAKAPKANPAFVQMIKLENIVSINGLQ